MNLVIVSSVSATGISVDAGLTPAEDRWIFRSLVHTMQRDDDPTAMDRKMERYTLNTVLAYGLRQKMTLMLKLPVVHQNMLMAGSSNRNSGLADLFLLAKYGVYRRNTREYTFGVATTLGLELPTGADTFSSETVDVKPGIYLSYRRGPWGSDFNIDYSWNGFADKSSGGIDPGDELSLDWAFAHQFSMNEKASIAWAPVLELSYKKISSDQLDGNNIANTGESVLFLSPGVKYTRSSLILEALIQFPVSQDQEGSQLKRGTGGLIGLRYMF